MGNMCSSIDYPSLVSFYFWHAVLMDEQTHTQKHGTEPLYNLSMMVEYMCIKFDYPIVLSKESSGTCILLLLVLSCYVSL